tara:strand:- start:459 stop:785 length:327 start_codon:yes stop_codon:yes gene_type:complete
MYRLGEPNEKCYKLADATWKMKMRYKKIENRRKENSSILLDAPPKEAAVDQRTKQKICCATTMAGKPCRFKAVVGDYCRKHKVSDSGMGKKVDVNSLLSQLDGIKITG